MAALSSGMDEPDGLDLNALITAILPRAALAEVDAAYGNQVVNFGL
jgi:hypothetical protein